MSCAAAGTRSTRSSSSSSGCTGRRRPTTTRMASRLHAAETRLRKFEDAGPPELAPREQNVRMRLRGGRTGKRAVICENLELTGLMRPFDLEVWYGERVAVLGSNGSGKSSFPAAARRASRCAHDGRGAPRAPGSCPGCSRRPTPGPTSRTAGPLEILMTEHALLHQRGHGRACAVRAPVLRPAAVSHLVRRPAGPAADLAAGAGAGRRCSCSTSRPTTSTWPAPRRCRRAWSPTQGTVLAVTHDRWFARSFDRFLVFGADGNVQECDSPVWDETRPVRPTLTVGLARLQGSCQPAVRGGLAPCGNVKGSAP